MPTPARLPRLAVALAAVLLPLPLALPLRADDGDLDPTFDGGAFTLGWGADHARATALEPLANGELLVGGAVGSSPGGSDGWAVIKLEADGSRDLVWGVAFQVVDAGDETMAATGDLYAMRRDENDRVRLAGFADAGSAFDIPMLVRLTPGGGLDGAFDGNGILLIDDMPEEWTGIETHAAEILPDGRSVFVGTCSNCPVGTDNAVWVTRRLADGAPDLSFSGDGWLSFWFSGDEYSVATSVAVDPSGRVVVGGRLGLIDSEIHFARFTPSGNFDGAFGGGDGIAGPFADQGDPVTLAIDPSTGRVASGSGNSGAPGNGEVNVFTAAGAPDTTFSGDGHVDLDLEEGTSIHGVAFQSDGKLLAVGSIDANGDNQGGFFLARLTQSGALDPTFDDNGVKRVEFDAAPNVRDRAFAVKTMGGRLVAVGFADEGGGQEEEMAVVRTQNALIFSDGFERGTAGAWPGL